MSRKIRLVSCVLLALASSGAYAQAQDENYDSGEMSPTSAPAAAPASAPAPASTSMHPHSTKADHALSRKVRATLTKTKGLHAQNITVRARGGAVDLDGSVPEADQVDLATTAAQRVAGVVSVTNHLTIKAPGQ